MLYKSVMAWMAAASAAPNMVHEARKVPLRKVLSQVETRVGEQQEVSGTLFNFESECRRDLFTKILAVVDSPTGRCIESIEKKSPRCPNCRAWPFGPYMD